MTNQRLGRILLGGVLLLFAVRPTSVTAQACNTETVSAAQRWSGPLAQRVTIHAADITLRDALAQLATKTRLRLTYSAELLPLDRRVCLAVDALPLGDVLLTLVRGANVRLVAAASDHIVVAPLPAGASTAPQTETVVPLDPVLVGARSATLAHTAPGVNVAVIEGWTLAQQSSSSLATAINDAVPGLWLWQQSPGTPLVQYGSMRGASSFGLTAPKLYVDGIEVANPLLFSRISPDAIERVEIIRGPQGAALYGANAMNGVVNIVTRHASLDEGAPRTRVRSALGLAATDYAADPAATHDHGISVRAGSATRSLLLNATAGGVGEFVTNGSGGHISLDASARAVGARTLVTGTLRFLNEQARSPLSPVLADEVLSPALNRLTHELAQEPIAVRQYTAGVSATLRYSESWTHAAVFGLDGYTLAGVPQVLLPWASEADLALRAAGDTGLRTTARLSSTGSRYLNDATFGSLTFVGEHSLLRQRGATVAFPHAQPMIVRRGTPVPRENDPRTGTQTVAAAVNHTTTGLSAQGQLAYDARFFLTGGVRLERAASDVGGAHTATLPLLGGSYVHETGPISLKLRMSYGKGVRWSQVAAQPRTLQRLSAVQHSDLALEAQEGIEAGFDLSFARTLSLHVTRFDQLASGLVQRVTLAPGDTMHVRPEQGMLRYQLQNIGEISNRGWEMEAGVARGGVSLSGTLALVDSRVQRLALGYSGDLQPGDRMLAVPSSTFSLTAALARAQWTAAVTAARAGEWLNYDRVALARVAADTAAGPAAVSGAQLRNFWRAYDGITHVRVNASRTIGRNIALTGTLDNLLNRQVGEPDNITIIPGRALTLGVRAVF